MGGRSTRVEYRTDTAALERMNKQHREWMEFMMKESQRREAELKKMMDEFSLSQRKNDENREKLLLIIKESDEKHQKEIMELMKINQENFVKLFNSKNSEELEKYKQICEENDRKSKLLEEQIEKLKKQNEEQYKEQELKLQEAINNAKDEFERKELERKQKEIEEKRLAEEKAFNEYKKLKGEYLTQEYEKIMKEFSDNELQFCQEEIEKIITDNIENFIDNIFEIENIDNIILKDLKEHIDKMISNPSFLVNHLNILLLGPSGVGKSTLINAVYKQEICKTGKGKPCTQGEPKYYTSENIEGSEKYIRLADSRGIEIGGYGVDEVVNSAKKFINYYLEQKDPDEYVHLIWYCVTGTRFEDIEQESLIELSKLYTDNNLPIIVVYTMATNSEQIPTIKKFVENMKTPISFKAILAKMMKVSEINIEIPPFGVEDLINLSIKKAKNAIGSSCNTALRKNCYNDIQRIIYEKADVIDEHVGKQINEDISEIPIGTDISKMSTIIGKTIIFIFLEYIKKQDNQELKEESNKAISDFVKMYFDEVIKAYQNKLFKIVENKTEIISNHLLDLQLQVINRNQGNFNVNQQMNKENIYQKEYSELSNKMKDIAEWICIKNSIRYLWHPINIMIKNKLSVKYQQCIDDNEELKKKFDEYAINAFNGIGENLKNIKIS